MKKFSIIIPTLFKRVDILKDLLQILYKDAAVGEILLIDNTGVYFDYDLEEHSKLRILPTEENLYVNPSWNIGVNLTVNDNIAILNDDIIVPNNIFSMIAEIPLENLGILGANHPDIVQEENPKPFDIRSFNISETVIRNWGFGIFMVMHKSKYIKIPTELKVWGGDDFLFHMNRKNGNRNGVFHFPIKTKMSATSDLPEFDEIKQRDLLLYNQIKNNFQL